MLMKGVDDVTLGMGGPADTLLISAKSGDPGLLEEQSKAISDLASSLQDIAQDAVKGYVCVWLCGLLCVCVCVCVWKLTSKLQ